MPPSPESKPWFPAKTHGWGWGPPTCWQGWVVIGIWLGLLIPAAWLVSPGRHLAGFIACVVALGGGLTAVCWLKGERPRWRWGQD